MIVALAMFAGAVAMAWLGPALLRWAGTRHRDPVPVMVLWLVSMVAVLFAAVTSTVLLLLPDHGAALPLLGTLHDSWSEFSHGSPPTVEMWTGIFGAALLLAGAVRLAVVSMRAARRRARLRDDHLGLLRLVAGREARRKDPEKPETLWLAHDRPAAFSFGGRPGIIVATEGLHRRLGSDGVAAVLAHERAHLAGLHHLLIATGEALRTVLPFVPLFRQAPAALRGLVEVAADLAAARRCGSAAVHSALVTMSETDAPDVSLAMGQNSVEIRLSRLRWTSRPPGRIRRAVACALAASTAAVLPFAIGTGLFLSAALLFHAA